ncbi:MAG: MOSC N-terminal beta barrel domain-containing protein [Acidobacteriota bacterium]|nr:MOSC N-terminal beta barrel domain-containing protein [Acidobacteriota bacterium]
MSVIGRVESLWRYPVKSMRGQEVQEAFAGFSGIYGDRYYVFRDSAAPEGFPYLTAREQEKMLLYRPAYRNAASTAQPPNLAAAEALPPGITPVYVSADGFTLDVETPAGETMSIDDPRLIGMPREGLRERHQLTLLRSERAMTDCRPISLFSLQTARQLSES